MSEPRTRRQLREALEAAGHERRKAAAEASAALREANQKASTAHRRANRAVRALDRLGFEEQSDADIRDVLGVLDIDNVWIPKADTPKTIPVETHEKIVDATIGEVQAGTRRETLAAVIDALQIKSDYGRAATPDALWADIQVALEVRAERKNAEQRDATEAKVSKIGKAPAFATGGVISGLPTYAAREFRPGDSYGAATTIDNSFKVPSTGLYRVGLDIAGDLASVLVKLPEPPFTHEDIENVSKAADDLSVTTKPKTTKKTKGDKS